MSKPVNHTTLLAPALAAALGLGAAAEAARADALFGAVDLERGYTIAAAEGSCGEGKCGASDGGDKDGEGKCGEGKCGA